MVSTIRWRRPWRLSTSWCINSVRMYLNGGRGVINCAYVGYIETPRFMTSSRWRRRRMTPARKSKRTMTISDTSWCHRPPWSPPPGCPCHPHCCLPRHTQDLCVFTHVENIQNFLVNQQNPSILNPSWRKFRSKFLILISTTSLVFLSRSLLGVFIVVYHQMSCP